MESPKRGKDTTEYTINFQRKRISIFKYRLSLKQPWTFFFLYLFARELLRLPFIYFELEIVNNKIQSKWAH